MSSDHVSRRHQWFTCVHLLISHLTQSSCAFSVTLTTPALYRRSLRWFGGCFQKPPPEGLPPSQLQLRADRLCSRVTPVPPWQFSFTAKEKLFFVLFVSFVVPFFSEPFATPSKAVCFFGQREAGSGQRSSTHLTRHLILQPMLGFCSVLIGVPLSSAAMASRRSLPVTGLPLPGRESSN